MAVITPGSTVIAAAAPAPDGSVLGDTDAVIRAIYREARVQTLLFAHIATLLSQIIGPAAPINGWTPLDPSPDLRRWRDDADMNFT